MCEEMKRTPNFKEGIFKKAKEHLGNPAHMCFSDFQTNFVMIFERGEVS